MKSVKFFWFFSLILLPLLVTSSYSQDYGAIAAQDIKNILPVREQAKTMDNWLKWRLDNIVPYLMRREGIDMWLVINRGENNPEPVYTTLVPETPDYSGRALIFHDRGEALGVERFCGDTTDIGDLYKAAFKEGKIDGMADLTEIVENLAEFIKERSPKKIGVNMSDNRYLAHVDGLTASYKKKLDKALGPEFSSRIVSAEKLSVGWLETRSPQELSVYRHICGVAHDLIAEFFSNTLIIPDITTTDDVAWWIRQRIVDIGLKTWFHPYLITQRYENGKVISLRSDRKAAANENVIRRGDLLQCDIGIVYLGLCTDNKQYAYVCKIGEDNAPQGLKEALRLTNKLQDIFMNEFKVGRTGNDVFITAFRKAKEEGLKSSIYSHPLGFRGHAAGPLMGPLKRYEAFFQFGDYPVYLNTCYSIELSNYYDVPEWGGQEVEIQLEEDAAFTKEGCHFIDGRQTQTKLYVIK
jgi:Xaa-Pro aminopeptidase